MTTGVAVDFDGDGTNVVGDEGPSTLQESLAGGFGIGGGLNDNFVEDVDAIVDALHEKHAHGIDVEIDGPDKWVIKLKADGLQVDGAVEGVIHAIAASAGELGFKFLTIAFGI